MSKLVSVIIPTFNCARYLPQAINSVPAQTYTTWEAIIVDDGSTDDTAAVVKQFTDPRIRYVYEQNRGQAAALNRGLDLATGQYITTLDADDWLTPNSLADRVQLLEEHPEYGAVYGDGYYCDAHGKAVASFADYRPANLTGDIYATLIWTNLLSQGSAVMFRRSIITAHQLRYDVSLVWCQDWDLYIRLAEKTSFGYVDSIVVKYRMHEANMTHTMPSSRRLDSVVKTKFKVLDSPSFAAVPIAHKAEFFHYFLVNNLKDRPEEQSRVISGRQFGDLPKAIQSRLLRLVATNNLLMGRETQVAKAWLWRAWTQAPIDLKAGLMAIVATLHPGLAGALVKSWRKNRQEPSMQSPLDILHNKKSLNPALEQ